MQDKITICQWCFEKPPIKNGTCCQECIDAVGRMNEESENFDLDKWLEEEDNETL